MNEQYEPLLRIACDQFRNALTHFVETGEESGQLRKHLDECRCCRMAVEKIMHLQMHQMEAFARKLARDAEKDTAQRRGLTPFDWFIFGAVSGLLLIFVLVFIFGT